MTKVDLINKIAEKSGYTKKDSKEVLEVVLEAITEGAVEDGELKLAGFGTFEVVESSAREGHNPQTGEPLMIPAKKRMAFRCSKTVKDMLNA